MTFIWMKSMEKWLIITRSHARNWPLEFSYITFLIHYCQICHHVHMQAIEWLSLLSPVSVCILYLNLVVFFLCNIPQKMFACFCIAHKANSFDSPIMTLLMLTAGGGNLICISHFPRLLCQQQLDFSAAWRTDRRWCLDQVKRITIL